MSSLNKLKYITGLRLLLLCFVAPLIFTGCGKHNETPVTAGKDTSADSYQPVTKGSYWTYLYTQNNVADTATTTMTGVKNTYDNDTYYEASTAFKLHKFSDAINYFSLDDHAYKNLTIAGKDTLSLYYFNDTTKLNHTWTVTVNRSGVVYGRSARLAGGIVEKNISLTVQGKIYTGVTHAKIYLQYYLGGNSYTTAETYDYFVVKNVGPIEVFVANSLGVTTLSEALIAYSIKQ